MNEDWRHCMTSVDSRIPGFCSSPWDPPVSRGLGSNQIAALHILEVRAKLSANNIFTFGKQSMNEHEHVYIYVCTYVYAHTCMYTYIYIHIHLYMHTYINTCIYI